MCHTTRRYTSDVTDKQWAKLEPLLLVQRSGRGRPLKYELRVIVNAIFYVLRTGCQWDELPSEYPNHNTVYYTFASGAAMAPGHGSTPLCGSRYATSSSAIPNRVLQ